MSEIEPTQLRASSAGLGSEERGLRWLRALWLATFAVILVLFLVGSVAYYQQMLVAPTAPLGGPATALPAMLAEAGIPAEVYAAYKLVTVVLGGFPVALVGLLIFWRRGHENSALLMSYLLLLAGASGPLFSAGAAQLGALGIWLDVMLTVASANAVTLIFFLFPDGRFVPRWTRWIALVYFLFTLPGFLAPDGRLDTLLTTSPIAMLLFGVLLLGSIIFAPIYRYRRVSGPIERVQTRWAMFGLLATVLAWLIGGLLSLLAPDLNEVNASTLRPLVFLNLFLFTSLYMLFPIGVGFAILRYRLYDIDIIIRKTLQYAVLSALLALVYFGSVILLQTLFGAAMEDSPLLIVLSTLLIAGLFTPLRRKVQEVIDRRFFRQKYNAEQVLERFARTARDEVDLEALTAELVQVAEETMRPERVSVWLKPAGRFSQSGRGATIE
jgi:hypothetical protein